MTPFRTTLPLLAASLLFGASVASAGSYPAEIQEFLDRVTPPIALSVPGADRVKVTKDVAYGSSPTQRCDVYRPAAAKRPAPIAILIAGGMDPGFPVRPKEWGIYQSWGRALAASGIVTVIPNHRGGFPEPALDLAEQDLRALLAHLRDHAREWGADPGRFAIAAYSGGGPLLSVPMRDHPAGLRALVGVYPIVDPERSEFLKSKLDAEAQRRFSPAFQLEAAQGRVPPFLVLRAGHDKIPDLLTGLDRFIDRAIALDAPVTVVNVPGAPHGFDNHPDVPGVREALATMVTFLRRNLDAG